VREIDELWALIPARSGSKGIKDKNLQKIHGHSLLAWSIAVARSCPSIARVIVSTDSPRYADEARAYGADVPFIRPESLALDDTTDFQVFEHFVDWTQEHCRASPHTLVHLRPTTPLRDPEVLARGARLADHLRTEVTSIRSVHEASETPYKWFRIDDEGFLTTMDGDRSIDQSNVGRQAFPSVYVPNGYVDFVFVNTIRELGVLHGGQAYPYITPRIDEVDTEEDLTRLRNSVHVRNLPPGGQTLREAKETRNAQ
jgi:N-acylneuraminate cytidylyltransferase